VWNLSILAGCLAPLVDPDEKRALAKLQEALSHFHPWFEARQLEVMAAKLGIAKPEPSDRGLVNAYLERLQDKRLDYTKAFRALSTEFERDTPFHRRWRARLEQEGRTRAELVAAMNAVNPRLIPRNHQIERAISEGREGRYEHFHTLADALKAPFADGPELEPFTAPPAADEVVHATFCGT